MAVSIIQLEVINNLAEYEMCYNILNPLHAEIKCKLNFDVKSYKCDKFILHAVKAHFLPKIICHDSLVSKHPFQKP